MMRQITFSGHTWVTQELWGRLNPKHPNIYYCDSSVKAYSDELILSIQHKPKLIEVDNVSYYPTYGVGLVTCMTKFSYGTFSIYAKLPKGPNLWPAFWLYGWNSWPPEVDVFEGYTNRSGSYLGFNCKNLFHWKLESNYHLMDSDGSKRVHKCRIRYIPITPSSEYIQYTIEWTPYAISIYYNTYLVRVITDENIIKSIETNPMRVILNNSCKDEFSITDLNHQESPFSIKEFNYIPYTE